MFESRHKGNLAVANWLRSLCLLSICLYYATLSNASYINVRIIVCRFAHSLSMPRGCAGDSDGSHANHDAGDGNE